MYRGGDELGEDGEANPAAGRLRPLLLPLDRIISSQGHPPCLCVDDGGGLTTAKVLCILLFFFFSQTGRWYR
jgi:hypothetical protein